MAKVFDMKNMGEASHILGMRIQQDRSKKMLYLSQEEYIDKVLQRFNMDMEKALMTPLSSYVKLRNQDCPQSEWEKVEMDKVSYEFACKSLMYVMVANHVWILPAYVKRSNQDCPQSKGEKAEMDKVSYASACGSIMYAMIATRLDIAFVVGVSMHICYGSEDLSVRGYTDSDYAGDLDKRRSTLRYVFTLAGGVISWRSRLQDCITQSTIEAKYVAPNEACKEAIWLGRLVVDLGVKVDMSELYCDSQSAIQLAKNPVFHSKTKHIDVKYHFIRKVLEDKQIQLMKIHTKDNPADLLTK
ncbi:hypothetical protein L7F22_016069 [Adiantum nelumboides]|nr:hypothetical protein [Adiantum nelumboides]